MSKLVMLKGLPASGKSTYAKELVSQGYKRVNKDLLREMIDCGNWTKANEKLIFDSEACLAHNFLEIGHNVVVDDCSFAHEKHWESIARSHGAEFEVKFFDTPINECVLRDAARGDKSVGGDVIFRMWYKYLRKSTITQESFNFDIPTAYIFDMDGTLALMKDRSPFDWARVGEDELDMAVGATLKALATVDDINIIIVSGRDIVCQPETEAWLKKYDLDYDMILMRPEGDTRKDSEIKKELYENNIKGKYNVLGVFDDRDSVVSLWRSLGLKCFQCDYGTF